jgi:hypothetical protein
MLNINLTNKELILKSIVDYDFNKIKLIIDETNKSNEFTTNEILQLVDITEIERLLDDETIYYRSSKDVFLVELKRKMLNFNNLKLDYKSIDETGGKYVIFSPDEEDLIIEFFFKEKDGKIIEIYNSVHSDLIDDFEFSSYYQFLFYEDKLINFYPSGEYLILSENAVNVCSIILNSNNCILTLVEVTKWLEENKELKLEVEKYKNCLVFVEFNRLYSFFHSITSEYLIYLSECKKALSDFIINNCLADKNNLIQWFVLYNRLKFEHIQGFNLFFEEFDYSKLELRCVFYKNIVLKGEEFATLYNFNVLFDEHYDSYLNLLSNEDGTLYLQYPN